MYSKMHHRILAFHGCDRAVGEKVLSGLTELHFSKNDYDWLGNGIYFWENDPGRALHYATLLRKNPERSHTKVKYPFVIGAVIDLGYCLDLLENSSLEILKQGYELLCATNADLPQNKSIGKEKDLLLRNLDCAVIQTVHAFKSIQKEQSFDSVRGAFWEGKDLYPNAGFKEKTHIQICVRNHNCIKGYFRPRNFNPNYDRV